MLLLKLYVLMLQHSFILNIKGYTSYYSCTKCWVKSKYLQQRICFSDTSCNKRTDDEFVLKSDENYHLGPSILEQIPNLGLVTNVTLDYLHLICLGVIKKLINLWHCDSLKVHLPFQNLEFIYNILETVIRPFAPFEFEKKSKSMKYYLQWKGTEFRQLLLYSGSVILNGCNTQPCNLSRPPEDRPSGGYPTIFRHHHVGNLGKVRIQRIGRYSGSCSRSSRCCTNPVSLDASFRSFISNLAISILLFNHPI